MGTKVMELIQIELTTMLWKLKSRKQYSNCNSDWEKYFQGISGSSEGVDRVQADYGNTCYNYKWSCSSKCT